MCDDCYDAVVEENAALEETVERYAEALEKIRALSESYRLYTNHMDPLTRELVQDIFKTYDDIAKKALDGDDE